MGVVRLPSSSPLVAGLLVAVSIAGLAAAQDLGPLDRERGLIMLRTIRKDVERHYYDSTFHGVDLGARWDSAATLIQTAQSNSQIFGVIAWTLLGLEDSHTLFVPPARVAQVAYGWEAKMVGDSCYIVHVDPKSDAAAQGLARGDHVLHIDQFVPNRRDFWKIMYWLHALSPQPAVRLVVRSLRGDERTITAASKVTMGRHIVDLTGASGGSDLWDLIRKAENTAREHASRFAELDRHALVWRMPTFNIDDRDLDRALGKAHDFPALVLDLRGNTGGAERALQRLLGAFVERPDTIGVLHRRTERRLLVITPRRRFAGRLAVLVDSRSGSAAELFAHTIKMRSRGVVLGDRTWGGVRRSVVHGHQIGTQTVVFYAVSVTDAEVVMDDGSRLEGVGMTPDEILLPTGTDLAAGRDPVLARALALVGVERSPEEAGRLLP